MMKRFSYLESCLQLQALSLLDGGQPPRLRDRMPRYDDGEPWGVSFFRTKVTDDSLANLTLPRTYFGRSEISRVSFRNTDFTESSLCWNDFVDVDFSATTLAQCDLRSSQFDRVKFIGADLRVADMRRSWFNACIFDDAIMDGAVLTRAQASRMAISETQRAAIDWRDEDGPEPDSD
jgi:BTB/POZ domain-containing protein KCTD9